MTLAAATIAVEYRTEGNDMFTPIQTHIESGMYLE